MYQCGKSAKRYGRVKTNKTNSSEKGLHIMFFPKPEKKAEIKNIAIFSYLFVYA